MRKPIWKHDTNRVLTAVIALLLSATTHALTGTGIAQAGLIIHAGGMVYDDVLNVTWLQDANFAKTSGYDADGSMTWDAARAWADQLVFGGFDDWRLPNTLPINGSAYTDSGLTHIDPVGDVWSFGWDGVDDRGYNITSINSQMSYMYYVNLENRGYFDSAGNHPQPGWGLANVGPFANLQSGHYWSAQEHLDDLNQAWNFNFGFGISNQDTKDHAFYAWAVRDGDVAAAVVPEPSSIAIWCGIGLFGIIAGSRWQRGNQWLRFFDSMWFQSDSRFARDDSVATFVVLFDIY